METLILMNQTLIPSIPNIPIFFTFYLAIYLIAYFIVFRNWAPNYRPEAASCAISFAHGTPAVFLAATAIIADPNRGFGSMNTIYQNAVLDYSSSYFLMDLCHYLIFYPRDIMFIGHHLATLFVFITSRYFVGHGAYAVLILLILAEVTSFCQNTWTLANARRKDLAIAVKVYAFVSPPFYVVYSLVRGLVGPFFVYEMGVFYWSGEADSVIPKWVWISWIAVVITAILVSWLWISNLWIEFYRERSGRVEKKTS